MLYLLKKKENNCCKSAIVGSIALASCVIIRACFVNLAASIKLHPDYYEASWPLLQPIPIAALHSLFVRSAMYDTFRVILTILGLWAGVIVGLCFLKEPIKSYKRYRGFVWGVVITKELPMFVCIWVASTIRDILLKLPHPSMFYPSSFLHNDIPLLLLTPLLGGFVFGWLSDKSLPVVGGILTGVTLLLIPPGYDRWAPLLSPFKCIMCSVYVVMGALGVYVSNILKIKYKVGYVR